MKQPNFYLCIAHTSIASTAARWTLLALLTLTSPTTHSAALAQQPPAAPIPRRQNGPAKAIFDPKRWSNWISRPYTPGPVGSSLNRDAHSVSGLLHDGKLTLRLEDVVELVIENNFDVEMHRFNLAFAATERLRSEGGGTLRGIPTTVSELPAGVGGPGEPLLATVGGYSPVLQLPSSAADLATITGTQSDLSVIDPTSLSSGTAIPQFDPHIISNLSLAQSIYPQPDPAPTGSNIFSSHSVLGSVGYSQAFATGTQLSAEMSGSRLREASMRFNTNPYYTAMLNISVAQPLFLGFGIGVNRRFIRIARSEHGIADEVFTQQLINTISDAIRLYWDLISVQQDLEVKRQSLDAAERLFKDTQNQVNIGTLAPIDLTAAMAQVASSRQAYINADGVVLQQELLLKEVLTRKGVSDSSIAEVRIEAITSPSTPDEEAPASLPVLIEAAMKQRPDIALARRQEANAELSLKGSRNALLPDLDLIASMQNNGGAGTLVINAAGLSGNPLGPPPPELVGDFGTALRQAFNWTFPDYSVGVQLNLPIRNRVARADYSRDALEFGQSKVRLQQLESQIRLQVGNAYIALRQARQSYKAAVEARKLQKQALDVESAKLEGGVATVYEFIQFQRNLAEAESAEVTTLGVYAKAKTALQRAVGATLTENNVHVEQAEQFR